MLACESCLVSFHCLFGAQETCTAQGEAPLAVLQWAAWQPGQRPQGLQIAEFFAANVAPEAAPPDSGPYLSAARVGAWGVLVAAHRKANDEHVKLYGACVKFCRLRACALELLSWNPVHALGILGALVYVCSKAPCPAARDVKTLSVWHACLWRPGVTLAFMPFCRGHPKHCLRSTVP